MEVGVKIGKNDGSTMVNQTLFRSLVGGLLYLTTTRPDLTYAVSFLSRFMESPKDVHWELGKRILRYVVGTINYGLHYYPVQNLNLTGYSDSDLGGDVDTCKSTSGYVFSISSSAISWSSKKQSIVALSTTESEYVALASAGCQARWLKSILEEMGQVQEGPTKLFCDNKSTICLSKNPMFHSKSKHIKIKFHFIRELIKDKEVEVLYCKSQDQLADLFTKPLKKELLIKMRKLIGVNEVQLKGGC